MQRSLNLLQEEVNEWENSQEVADTVKDTKERVRYIIEMEKNQNLLETLSRLSWSNIEWIKNVFSVLWDYEKFVNHFWIPENLKSKISH